MNLPTEDQIARMSGVQLWCWLISVGARCLWAAATSGSMPYGEAK